MTAAHVRVGDRIRLATGVEMQVSRIEPAFFGRAELVAFIEDTATRWYKQPVPVAAEIEVSRAP
jgi:hypothetical protein